MLGSVARTWPTDPDTDPGEVSRTEHGKAGLEPTMSATPAAHFDPHRPEIQVEIIVDDEELLGREVVDIESLCNGSS